MASAEFSQNIHSFMGNSFANSFQAQQYTAWETGKAYTIGDVVFNNNGKYAATTSGTSGASGPSHVDGILTDGGVDWIFVEGILQSNSFQNNLYIFSGRMAAWEDEDNPPDPTLSNKEEYDTFSDIIAMKKISSDEVKLGIRRVNWTSGTVYSEFDNTKKPFVNVSPETAGYDHDFYVITPSNYIYKCINNNNGAQSVSMPNTQSTGLINTGDGYVWKFMGAVGVSDASRFLTATFVPVEYKTWDDGTVQWDVQAAAQTKSISTFKIKASKGDWTGITPKTTIVQPTGAGTGCTTIVVKSTSGDSIAQVLASTPGSNYEPDTYAVISNNAVSSGSGATASVSSLSGTGVIADITVDSGGSSYTSGASAVVFDRGGNGSGAVLSVTLSSSVVTDIIVTSGGSGYIDPVVVIVPGAVAVVATAITAPLRGHGSNIVTELGANLAIISCQINNNDYFLYGSANKFRQIGVITDVIDNDTNSYAIQQHYIGPGHPEYENTTALKKIKRNTGSLLYLNNTTAVVRASDQEEHLKISIAF